MRRILLAVLASVLGTVVAVPMAAAAQTRTAESCAASLNCSFDDIDHMSMTDRLTFVRAMESGPVAAWLPGDVDPGRWRNIEGIVAMFDHHGLGAPGSWVSCIDAGILEGVERGVAIATGRSTDTAGNPGAQLWADYLRKLAAGELSNRGVHDRTWSKAEQSATDYGDTIARQRGQTPDQTEQRFWQETQVYRLVLRNRPLAMDVLAGVWRGANLRQRQDFYDWATDSTNYDAGIEGAELLWHNAELNGPASALDVVTVLHTYFAGMLPAYRSAIDH